MKANNQRVRIRRRKGTGTVIAKDGIWVCRYIRDGKMVQESTHLKATKANRSQAETILNGKTAINSLLSEHERIAVLLKEKEAIEAKIARLQGLAAPKLTLGDLAEAYTSSPRRKDHSQKQLGHYIQLIDSFVAWAGDAKMPVEDIDDKTVERYAQSLGAKVAGTTYNIKINMLDAVWRALEKSHGIASNPWATLPRKRKDVHTKRVLTHAEIDRILSFAKGEMRDLIIIGLRTGLRLGDACQLKWDAFQKDGTLEVPTQKTGAVVHIPSASLLADLGRQKKRGYIVPSMARAYLKSTGGASAKVTQLFEAAGIATHVKKAGWKRQRAEVSFHSLRHTFVTRALESGIPQAVVQALVGHTNKLMTEKYTHIGNEAVVAAFTKAGM